jgi:hypothetical protein
VTADRRVVLLLLDGARHDVFAELAARGDLPHVSRHLLESGGTVPATTVFPSTTGVAYLPFLTGCYPGTCDVPGIRWLDVTRYGGRWWHDRHHVRSYCGYQGGMLNTDLRPGIATLFDLVPESVALCSPFVRGLGRGRERAAGARKLWGGLAHYTGGYGVLERAVGRTLAAVARERHRFVFAVFPGVDGVTHFHDPRHPDVLATYREFDRLVGDYAVAGGFAGDHLTLLVSDHGLSPVARHTDVALALEALGLPTLRHPIIWRREPAAAVMVSGNASVQVYWQPGRRRERRLTIDEVENGEVAGVPREAIQYLASRPGIALVAGIDGDAVTLVSTAGRARLVRAGADIAYQPETADVLELGGAATLSDRAWLARSIDTRFPDAPTQLLQLSASSRTGDLVVIAAEGADLRLDWEIPEHRSGHGSLHREHMRCLLASNVPLRGPLRTADLFPLILDYLDVPIPERIDGVLPGARVAR